MTKHILYLASGNSRRFGANKLLFPFQEKPLFLHGLLLLQGYTTKHPDCTLTVVSRYEEIRQTAAALGISFADSPDSDKGISYTIKAGLTALGTVSSEDFILFVVADQPFLTEASLDKLFAYAVPGTEGATLAYGDRPGNPNLFSAGLIPELMQLEGDKGGRAVLKKHTCVMVQANSEAELNDIDTQADL